MKKIISIAMSLVIPASMTVSCGGGAKNVDISEPWRISLAPTEQRGDVPFPTLSEMVDQIEYVKLEYVPEIPVGGVGRAVNRPVITDDYIIISDGQQGVLQYSRDGKFIRRVGHIGRGPGEYPQGNVIRVDEQKGILYIIPSIYPVLRYELDTGRFIDEVTIAGLDDEPVTTYMAMPPLPMTDDLWLISQNGATMFLSNGIDLYYSWFMLDVPAMRIIRRQRSRLYDNYPSANIIHPTPTWRDSGGRMNFYENLADTMFVVNVDGSTTPRIFPDFGPHGLKAPVGGDTGARVDRIMESGRYILFEGTFRYMNYMVAFDKTTGKRGLRHKGSGIETNDNFWGPANDIDGGFSRLFHYDENIWWAPYEAYDMLERLTPEHFESVRSNVRYPDRLEKLQTLVGSLQESDNPVIAIAKLKK